MPPINQFSFSPRGLKAMLPHGGLPEIISPYLLELIKKTGGANGPIGKQFISQPDLESQHYQKGAKDPLIEDQYEVAPGLIYKYKGKVDKRGQIIQSGRVLWTITRFCAAYCRFCTRGREIGLPANKSLLSGATIAKQPFLTNQQLNQVFSFLKEKEEINELIVSGGDPLTTPKDYLTTIINGLVKLQQQGHLKIIRLGTRLPISNPIMIKNWHYQLLATISNLYLMVHINHPLELTNQALIVLNNFKRKSQATIMSQSVLLKGVNDSAQTLYQLFVKLSENGIRPYYVFQNDPVYWAHHFTVPIKKTIKIWGQLRPQLSGISATARLVIDTPFGHGKIPLPEGNAWQVDYRYFTDFHNKKHSLLQ